MSETHNDGMSSDDEVPDVEFAQYKEQLGENFLKQFSRVCLLITNSFCLAQLKSDAAMIFDEVMEEYCELEQILPKFDEWKKKEVESYKQTYVHLCLPKIVSIFVRAEMILWSPFQADNYEDIDKMKWFHALAMYGKTNEETEETLRNDPDVFLIPTVVEKIILPKLSSKY
jgi:GC-rich sequence DNA-binding factor